MKIEFIRDPGAEEIHVKILARERSREVEALIQRLKCPANIIAYNERGETPLQTDEIIRVYTQQRKVMVDSARGTFGLRQRLYELEEMLDGEEFVRISNSEIVSRRCIRHLDFSLSGTIMLSLKGGITTYVSRRYVARIRKLFES